MGGEWWLWALTLVVAFIAPILNLVLNNWWSECSRPFPVFRIRLGAVNVVTAGT